RSGTGAGLAAAVARAVALVVVVRQHVGGPGGLVVRVGVLHAGDHQVPLVPIPPGPDGDEVHGAAHAVAVAAVGRLLLDVAGDDLADDEPLDPGRVDHLTDPADQGHGRLVVGEHDVVDADHPLGHVLGLRVLADGVDDVDPEHVDAPIHPESQHVVLGGLD